MMDVGSVTVKPNPVVPMDNEKIRKTFEDALVFNNLAFVLSEAVNGFFGDMTERLALLGLGFKHEDKKNFTELKKAAERAEYYSRTIAKSIYDIDEAKDALHDADWWYYFIKLVMDRTGDDPRKTHMLLEFLDTMPSEGIFKVGMKDFRNI